MSGVLNAMVAPSADRVFQTLEDLLPGYGSPSLAVSLRGNTTYFLRYRADTDELLLQLSDIGSAQSFFSYILVEGATPGTFQSYRSADATYSLIGGVTAQWTWTEATLWSAADISEVKVTEFHF